MTDDRRGRVTTFEYVEPETGSAEINISGVWDVGVLDRFIETLGDYRATLQPAVSPRPMPPQLGIKQVDGTGWQVLRNSLSGQYSLQVRHPGFGWLTFRLPDGALEYLRNDLAPRS